MGSKAKLPANPEAQEYTGLYGKWLPIPEEGFIWRACQAGVGRRFEFGWIEIDTPEGLEWSRAVKITEVK